MKKTRMITIIIVVLSLLVCGTVFTINAVNSDDIGDYDEENIILETISEEDFAVLDEKNRRAEEILQKEDENDIIALEILRNHNATDATELILDKQQDCELMFKICDMIKNNAFSDDEMQIIENYLTRRLPMLSDFNEETGMENDHVLITKIEETLQIDG